MGDRSKKQCLFYLRRESTPIDISVLDSNFAEDYEYEFPQNLTKEYNVEELRNMLDLIYSPFEIIKKNKGTRKAILMSLIIFYNNYCK